MFAALLDTCVLWRSLQRDFLLSLAIEGMYRPIWSTAILEELEYEEAAKLVDRGATACEAARRARHLIAQIRNAFTDAEATGWEALEGTYNLPDPDDEHIVAAAFVSGAGVIVTRNFRDFPADKLPNHILAVNPMSFARDSGTESGQSVGRRRSDRRPVRPLRAAASGRWRPGTARVAIWDDRGGRTTPTSSHSTHPSIGLKQWAPDPAARVISGRRCDH